VTRITGDKDEVRIPRDSENPTIKPRIASPRGLIAMLLGWYPNAYSLAGVTLF
jgi:hypothetical protein